MKNDNKMPKTKLLVLLLVYIALVIGLAVYLYS
ncbi:hypothetical protein Tola_2542 [Tolumonas auensis DSM 9187]|uniref:Uncharacterized protein n=1 Tax=Tolumonas auensis (strain DSM 9187 / NBRC 110442 / TA 4) TaxID=595494 RepID=C4LAG1_TOLAT|nr:hypothetical protein Tola_2542 [Tolumonas auensis DSM 9187]